MMDEDEKRLFSPLGGLLDPFILVLLFIWLYYNYTVIRSFFF
jgi:hypothetical protein